MRIPLLLLCLLLCLPVRHGRAQDSTATDSTDTRPESTSSEELTIYDPSYYLLESLNTGLDSLDERPNLQTPQAAVEYFVQQSRAENYAAAAHVLNLNMLPDSVQAARAAELAERLYYVVDKQIGFDWEGLPDRPDGVVDQAAGPNDALLGEPRRSHRMGTILLDGRDIAIRVQRVKVGEAPPIWVFSPQTVENIDPLHERYGPGFVDSYVPEWARVEILGQTELWAWIAFLAFIMFAALIAYVVRRFAKRMLSGADSHWVQGLSEQMAAPIAVATAFLLIYIASSTLLVLPGLLTGLLMVLTIGAFVWLAMRIIAYFTEHIAGQDIDDITELTREEGADRQRWLTYLSVGRRVLLFVVFLLGLGIIVSRFQSLQVLGFSMIASAGVATVLLGIAAQPLIGNIVAGLQIALAKPVRIGDSVYYEDNWGFVEDITYTYILIQTWDLRRVVVPLRYFITHPFENWTIRSSHLIKPIYLYTDYTIDVERVREKFDELLRDSEEWDEEKEPVVQMTSAGDETIELRCLCSAKDPMKAWQLHCKLREELVEFVRDLEEGRHLPHRRLILNDERRAEEKPADNHRNGQEERQDAEDEKAG